ncbi:MAG: hypothetical protein AB7P69_15720 [Candidatus Binatia bacterium]
MSGSRRQQSWRWLTLAVLPAFLGFLLQPQVNTFYHVHRGGEYTHIHAWLPTSLNAPDDDDHHHKHHHHSHFSHHHHTHAAGLQHTHPHQSAASPESKGPQIRGGHTPRNGHRHTTIAFHWASLTYQESQSLVSLIRLLQQVAGTIVVVPLILAFRSRAPPALS